MATQFMGSIMIYNKNKYQGEANRFEKVGKKLICFYKLIYY